MSRSYRKPWAKDGYKGSKRKQAFKKFANKRVRNSDDIPRGKAYRKFFEPWEICDFNFWIDIKKEGKPWKFNRK